MQIHLLETGTLITKGSAMFCGLEQVNWQKHYPEIDGDKAKWAMRSLLIIHDDFRILIDTGPGTKLDAQTLTEYKISNTHLLIDELAKQDFKPEDITHVILTHLHFDHSGGSTFMNDAGEIVPTFSNAQYFVSEQQFKYALNPIPGDEASYCNDDFFSLEKMDRLNFIEESMHGFPFLKFKMVHGHTSGQIIPIIHNGEDTFVFGADLLPSVAHIPENHIMAYDINPALSKKEKQVFIDEAKENGWFVLLQHDLENKMLRF